MPDSAQTQTIGVTEEGWLTDSWYFACASSELKPGNQFRRIILGQPVLLARTKSGEAFALRDICPHRLVPLSAGQQVDTFGKPTIQCPYHGWRFGTDGQCRHMPSLVDEEDFDFQKIRVRAYPTHEANGVIYIYVSHNPRSDDPPVVPAPDFELEDLKPKFIVTDIFNAHMDDAVVGLMDPAHVPFVHNQWWWRPPSTGLRLKEKPFEPRERGWAIARHTPASNSLAYKWLFGGKVDFVLAGSGHIAGVVNPPASGKYQFWTGSAPKGDFEEWIDKATEVSGSWWPHWDAWIRARNEVKAKPRKVGESTPTLGDAPGEYVKVRV